MPSRSLIWTDNGGDRASAGIAWSKELVLSPAEKALWERSASNAGYHYLSSAKTFALMGKAFAEATLEMRRNPPAR